MWDLDAWGPRSKAKQGATKNELESRYHAETDDDGPFARCAGFGACAAFYAFDKPPSHHSRFQSTHRCAGLTELTLPFFRCFMNDSNTGPGRRRLMGALLHTLEKLPEGFADDGQPTNESAALILELGAPRLECLKIKTAAGTRCLSRLGGLETLDLTVKDGVADAVKEMMTAAGGWGGFLSSLKKLTLTLGGDGACWAFFETVGQVPVMLPRLETLMIYRHRDLPLVEGELTAVQGAFSVAMGAGAFASIQKLLWYLGLCSDDLALLAKGLRAAPLAQNLQSLDVNFDCGESSVEGMRELGVAIGAGSFPKLEELTLASTQLHDAAADAFFSALTVAGAPSLRELEIYGKMISDGGLVSLAKALQEGRLGLQLHLLRVAEVVEFMCAFHIMEVGVCALAEALEQGGEWAKRLRDFSFGPLKITAASAKRFFEAVVTHCPDIREFKISYMGWIGISVSWNHWQWRWERGTYLSVLSRRERREEGKRTWIVGRIKFCTGGSINK